ncbi:hypothetical protein [Geodermatophilus sp. SYSU D00815]
MSALISAQLDRVAALAAELAALAQALAEDGVLCTSTARSLSTSLGGSAGWWAGGAGHGWAGLLRILAERAEALAGTLAGAVEEYRRYDALLSERVSGRVGSTAIAR